jgi:hypothetical protein
MPTLVGFSTFAALSEEQITEKIRRRILSGDQGMLVWWNSSEILFKCSLRDELNVLALEKALFV